MNCAKSKQVFFLKVRHKRRVYHDYGRELGHAGLAVYDFLCAHADYETGQTFVGRRTVCWYLRVSPATFQEKVDQLTRLRLIAVKNGEGSKATT